MDATEGALMAPRFVTRRVTMTTETPEPGPQLDALVAVRVMGIADLHYFGYAKDGKKVPYYVPSGKPWATHAMDSKPVPRYSTDISAAWQVVEKLKGLRAGGGATGAYTGFRLEQDGEGNFVVATGSGPDQELRTVVAPTAPEAICRAALEAVVSPSP